MDTAKGKPRKETLYAEFVNGELTFH